MTALLIPPARSDDGTRRRRPLTLVTTLGGAVAAASTLTICLVIGVVGWFAVDAGAHGLPRDGLRTGALAWLTGHGSGVHVRGAWVGMVPLGLLALAGWMTWRIGAGVGERIAGHGPDADRLADGERDWTVPAAVTLFTAGYLVVALGAGVLASTDSSAPSLGRTTLGAIALGLAVGGPAIAIGSGRAATWLATVPAEVRVATRLCGTMVAALVGVSALLLAGALVLGFGDAASVLSRLHTDAAGAATLTAGTLAVLPNAILFASAYLLGPGFTVGADTVVSPGVVQVGELPLFPLLAALPADGLGSAVSWSLMAVPLLVAMAATMLVQRHAPILRWERGAIRGGAAGILAGVVLGLLLALAGGPVGPGRMADVAPLVSSALVHAITLLGMGGLLGGLVATGWQRRGARRAED